jgi:hypothetical protein
MLRLTSLALTLAVLSATPVRAQEVVVISSFQRLEFKDALTFADRGVIPTPGFPSLQSFSYARSGVFYRLDGVGGLGQPQHLERLDCRTGSVTVVGSLGQDVIDTGLALDPTTGELYALGWVISLAQTALCRIDKATGLLGIVALVTPLNLGAETFAIDATGHAFVITEVHLQPGQPFSLRAYAVDLTTGALTVAADFIENPGPNFSPGTGAFRSDGIYLLGSSQALYALDFTTLHATIVAPLNSTPLVTVAPASGVGLGFTEGCSGLCPCTAAPAHSGNGCLNGASQFFGSSLRAFGEASLSSDTLKFFVLGVPNTSFVLFQGSTLGAGSIFGDGRRCVGGTVLRLGGSAITGDVGTYPSPGQAAVSVQGEIAGPGSLHYQALFRDLFTYCTSATSNLTNSVSVTWTP